MPETTWRCRIFLKAIMLALENRRNKRKFEKDATTDTQAYMLTHTIAHNITNACPPMRITAS